MSLRIALYAEGGGETGHGPGFGEILSEEELGPAHDLVRRCITEAKALPEGAVLFQRPLRLRGKTPRGSDLLVATSARKLLAWPPGSRAPEFAVFLVDGDGDPSRRATVEHATVGALVETVIGVATQEFEAWLIADDVAVSRAMGATFPTQKNPEEMKPREAKNVLADAIGRAGSDPRVVRRTIARTCGLDVVSSRCPSFRRLREDLLSRV
jgi:uncharacterized protein DUF4276